MKCIVCNTPLQENQRYTFVSDRATVYCDVHFFEEARRRSAEAGEEDTMPLEHDYVQGELWADGSEG